MAVVMDEEPPFFSVGDKVCAESDGMIGIVKRINKQARRVNDRFLMCGKWYSTFDLTLLKRNELT